MLGVFDGHGATGDKCAAAEVLDPSAHATDWRPSALPAHKRHARDLHVTCAVRLHGCDCLGCADAPNSFETTSRMSSNIRARGVSPAPIPRPHFLRHPLLAQLLHCGVRAMRAINSRVISSRGVGPPCSRSYLDPISILQIPGGFRASVHGDVPRARLADPRR